MAKNDLSKYKEKGADNSKNGLPDDEKVKAKSAGRKPKPQSEKASKPVTLKFTESELKVIEKKSGLVPNATFLKNILLTETDLFR